MVVCQLYDHNFHLDQHDIYQFEYHQYKFKHIQFIKQLTVIIQFFEFV